MASATIPMRPGPGILVYGDPQLHTDGDVLGLVFATDGTLWSVEEPGVVRGWDAVSGRQRAWHALSDLETLWCFSSDGRVLGSGSAELSLWDVAGSLLTALPQPSWVTALAFHPDPTFLATGHDDGVVRIWDVPGHRLVCEMSFHKRPVSALAFSTDGNRLASAGEDKLVAVWEHPDGNLLRTCRGHTDRIPALAWHPDGDHVVSAGWDSTARVWDGRTGEAVFIFNDHASQVTALAFNADGTLLACADSVAAVHVWAFAERTALHVLNTGETDVRSLAFSADSQRLAAGGSGRRIHVWDPVAGRPLVAGTGRAPGRVSLALSPDGTRLASNGSGGPVHLWDTASRRSILELTGSGPVHTLAYSADGRLLAGGTDSDIWLWDPTKSERLDVLDAAQEPITALAFAPDSATLAYASASGLAVWLWGIRANEPVLVIPDALDGCTVEALAFHPKGRLLAVGGIDWLATGGSDGAVSVWDVVGRYEVATFGIGAVAVAFHPSGRRLAAASLDQSVCIWDLETQELLRELTAHDAAVTCVAYHPHGQWLASAGEDRTVRLWDEATGSAAGILELDTQVKALYFSADGRYLFTGNGNTTCYQLEVGRLLSNGS
jgi:WD40 repeat protein